MIFRPRFDVADYLQYKKKYISKGFWLLIQLQFQFQTSADSRRYSSGRLKSSLDASATPELALRRPFGFDFPVGCHQDNFVSMLVASIGEWSGIAGAVVRVKRLRDIVGTTNYAKWPQQAKEKTCCELGNGKWKLSGKK